MCLEVMAKGFHSGEYYDYDSVEGHRLGSGETLVSRGESRWTAEVGEGRHPECLVAARRIKPSYDLLLRR